MVGASTVRDVHVALQAARSTGLTTTLKTMQVMVEKGLLRKFYREFREHHLADPTGIQTLLRVTGEDSLKELEARWLKFLEPLRFRR